jgi:3-oxo-5alpha-steroid 4-dehydrogenase
LHDCNHPVTKYTHSRNATTSFRDRLLSQCHSAAQIKTGPFYAINHNIAGTQWLTAFLTVGGLATEGDSGLVVNGAGDAIPNLYAAGRNASGLPAASYISGLSLGDCWFTGRRAGKHAFTKA